MGTLNMYSTKLSGTFTRHKTARGEGVIVLVAEIINDNKKFLGNNMRTSEAFSVQCNIVMERNRIHT
jgi:hypothetical protein